MPITYQQKIRMRVLLEDFEQAVVRKEQAEEQYRRRSAELREYVDSLEEKES